MRGKRGPILAGAGVAALAVLLVVFLVLPKMTEVSEARTELEEAQNEQVTLESQLQALQDAQAEAPEARQVIAEVDRQIPPTADLPGLILLLQNAAVGSGLELVTLTPGTPTFDPATGLSVISVGLNGVGSYFDVAELMFRIETLPRAAKTLNLSLSPGGAEGGGGGDGGDGATTTTTTTTTGSPELTVTATVDLYTADTSAGPGSIPGPTSEVPAEAGA